MLLMKEMCMVVMLFNRIRTYFCWNEENRIGEISFSARQNGFWLFLFRVYLCCFSMSADFIVGKFFFVTLDVLDVVKVINRLSANTAVRWVKKGVPF